MQNGIHKEKLSCSYLEEAVCLDMYISIVMKADTKPLLYKDMTAIVEAIPENN